jgi:hypothetical protein
VLAVILLSAALAVWAVSRVLVTTRLTHPPGLVIRSPEPPALPHRVETPAALPRLPVQLVAPPRVVAPQATDDHAVDEPEPLEEAP